MSGAFRLADRAARERAEEQLALAAARSARTRGRARPEPEDQLRTAYERDRDRILHAKAFRRLKHKTQVFLHPDGDHFVTRLTHTLQVTQVARSLATALSLNETLAEAIALAHDVGHSPFGHIGEEALDPYVAGGWHHAAQGVRIVEVLEDLNLTWEVRDGVRAHSWKITPPPSTREGECVRYADRIGYLSHDALDAVRAGVLRVGDLPARTRTVFGDPGSAMVGSMIDAVVAGTLSPANTGGAVVMAPDALEAMAELRAFMFARVYESDTAAGQKNVAIDVIRRLVDHHLAHPELIPASYRDTEADAVTQVVDYVTGMTDRFALATHDRLFDDTASLRMRPLLVTP
ncbi:Deoxyguanosinetriphosphate triphosphohydrolase-like protein [Modestobacter italicus]|uniref:Deoxyguanosinetriphosphate triphosphohydrolase-like protein n=1 Tax=Modestobacter italicus (strain DSM 44449 / CECT 9708 / BC 501) TaxID=2732864 RepID=I4EXA6_MODI5|nr:HD domain-containing protein [Modestobacter marinus]CCH88019.1 Deoxyguanosinetriphosphate triphosphohydrolase-like protein [Modestobacter marinus]